MKNIEYSKIGENVLMLFNALDEFIEDDLEMIPSDKSINISYKLLIELSLLNIGPSKVSINIEGDGIVLSFNKSDLNMFIEIYNDGIIGYIISNPTKKRILKNEEISVNNIIEKIEEFFGSI